MHLSLALVLFALDFGLVAFLGSEDFPTRIAAEETLRSRSYHARHALFAGTASDDSAVRAACRRLDYEAREDLIRTFHPLPEIDGAWYVPSAEAYQINPDTEDIYRQLVPFLDAVGRDFYPWDNYRTATEMWIRWELERGTDPDALRPLVDWIRVRDAAFLGKHLSMAMFYYQHFHGGVRPGDMKDMDQP